MHHDPQTLLRFLRDTGSQQAVSTPQFVCQDDPTLHSSSTCLHLGCEPDRLHLDIDGLLRSPVASCCFKQAFAPDVDAFHAAHQLLRFADWLDTIDQQPQHLSVVWQRLRAKLTADAVLHRVPDVAAHPTIAPTIVAVRERARVAAAEYAPLEASIEQHAVRHAAAQLLAAPSSSQSLAVHLWRSELHASGCTVRAAEAYEAHRDRNDPDLAQGWEQEFQQLQARHAPTAVLVNAPASTDFGLPVSWEQLVLLHRLQASRTGNGRRAFATLPRVVAEYLEAYLPARAGKRSSTTVAIVDAAPEQLDDAALETALVLWDPLDGGSYRQLTDAVAAAARL